jgi:galactoside O-acetyltransferase
MGLIKLLKSLIFELIFWFLCNFPTRIGYRLRYYCYKPFFKKAGKFSFASGVDIVCFSNIEIGNNVNIARNSSLIANYDGKIIFGDNITIGEKTIINSSCNGLIEIGDDCAIAPNVYIRASNHEYKNPNKTIIEQGHIPSKIIIGCDVWIGAGVILLPGTSIQKGAILGAGSVLTKNIGENEIFAGVPAKFVKNRFK